MRSFHKKLKNKSRKLLHSCTFFNIFNVTLEQMSKYQFLKQENYIETAMIIWFYFIWILFKINTYLIYHSL